MFGFQRNLFISSPCQGSVLGPIVFIIFINDLTDSPENPPHLFADDSTLCCDISHPSAGQAAASPLTSDLDKITNWSNTILLMYQYCPPFVFSLTPHRYLHPLFVHLCLLSPSALLLVFPLSPAVPFEICTLRFVKGFSIGMCACLHAKIRVCSAQVSQAREASSHSHPGLLCHGGAYAAVSRTMCLGMWRVDLLWRRSHAGCTVQCGCGES